MSDGDPGGTARRPRPQFGEFATPEEQRAAIAVPDALTSAEPVPVAPDRDAVPARAPEAVASTERPPADRFVSWALLGLGLFNILTSTAALFDLPSAINSFFAADDLGGYGPVAAGRTLGIVALLITVVLWVVAFRLVQRRVLLRRSSWWIPIIAGVVANLVVLVCVGAAMMIDPAVFGHIQQMSGTMPPRP